MVMGTSFTKMCNSVSMRNPHKQPILLVQSKSLGQWQQVEAEVGVASRISSKSKCNWTSHSLRQWFRVPRALATSSSSLTSTP
jgi:hypothetical protein